MKNSATTSTDLGSRLLGAFVWELSLLGHKTLDLVKVILRPGGWFRSLPHVRILLVLSMIALIFNDEVSFRVSLGGDAQATATPAQIQSPAINAGFFNGPSGLISGLFTSSAFAKTDLTVMDSKTGLALIDRFDAAAHAEQEKLGIDAGVLLAAAIAAGAVETPEQVEDILFTTNFFGSALEGSYPSAWSSWRAMSLAILASTNVDEPSRDDFVFAAAAQFSDKDAAQARIYEALRFYAL